MKSSCSSPRSGRTRARLPLGGLSGLHHSHSHFLGALRAWLPSSTSEASSACRARTRRADLRAVWRSGRPGQSPAPPDTTLPILSRAVRSHLCTLKAMLHRLLWVSALQAHPTRRASDKSDKSLRVSSSPSTLVLWRSKHCSWVRPARGSR